MLRLIYDSGHDRQPASKLQHLIDKVALPLVGAHELEEIGHTILDGTVDETFQQRPLGTRERDTGADPGSSDGGVRSR